MGTSIRRAPAVATAIGVLFALAVWASTGAAQSMPPCDPVRLATIVTPDRHMAGLDVAARRLRNAPDWAPGRGETPISADQAVTAAQNWLHENEPNFGPVRILGVQLKQVSCETLQEKWFYQVEYSKLVQGDIERAMQPRHTILVLMDGTTVARESLVDMGALPPIAGPAPTAPQRHHMGEITSSLVIDLSHPEVAREYDGVEAGRFLGARVYNMLREGKFDELESQLTGLVESRQRIHDGNWAYSTIMYGFANVIEGREQWEPALERIRIWRTNAPRSRHAPLAEALYWKNYAWAARGTGFADMVSDKGWQLFRERVARARKILDESKSNTGDNPLWHSLDISLARDEGRPDAAQRAKYDDAVKREASFLSNYYAFATHLAPRWGGGIEQYRKFVDDAVARTRVTDGETLYARLYIVYAEIEFDRAFASLGIPWTRMKAGFDDMMVRYPSSWNVNLYAAYACQANDRQAFLNLLPKLTPTELRSEAWPTGFSFENCKETFTSRT